MQIDEASFKAGVLQLLLKVGASFTDKEAGKIFFSRAQISIFIIRRLQYIRWRRHFLLLSSIPYWPSIIRPNGLFFWTASKLLVFRRRFWWRATPTVSESLQRSLYGQWRKYTTWNGTSNCGKTFIIVKIWFRFALFCERIYKSLIISLNLLLDVL